MFMLKKNILSVAICLLLTANALVYALALDNKKPAVSIVVEVNSEPITNEDINKRVALVMLSAGEGEHKVTPEIIDQVKDALIQEKLQRLIAKQLKTVVSAAEVDGAINGIAKENNMDSEDLKKLFQSKGVDIRTLRERVESNLLWIRSVRQAIGAHTTISEVDVSNEKKKMEENDKKEQFELAEIVLFIDKPENQKHVTSEINSLYKQLKEGAPFPALARNFSHAPSGAQGGLVGWFTEEQMPEETKRLKVGQYSEPVLRSGRYTIYYVKDHKTPGQAADSEAKISYLDVKIELSENLKEEDQNRLGQFLEQAKTATGCKVLKTHATVAHIQIDEMNDVPVAGVPDGIRKLFAATPKGKATEPIRLSETDLRVFMLCEQKAPEKKKLPSDEEIRMMLKERRVQEMAITQFNRWKSQATIRHRAPR